MFKGKRMKLAEWVVLRQEKITFMPLLIGLVTLEFDFRIFQLMCLVKTHETKTCG